LGLALATWLSRLGRAAFVSAAICVLMMVGWFMAVATLFPIAEYFAAGSPFFGAGQSDIQGGS
jgi:hypothetical protein